MSETEETRQRDLLNVIERYFTTENPDEDIKANNVSRSLQYSAGICGHMARKESYDACREGFKGLAKFAKEKSIKPRSSSHGEFIVLVHHKDDKFSKQNCLFIIQELAHRVGDTASLEQIMRDYRDHPGIGFVMNNLGGIFCDKACYGEAKECFKVSQISFEQEHDHLGSAIAKFNLGILQKVLGHNEEAKQLLDMAADECVQDPEIEITDVELLSRVLTRLAYAFEELGEGKRVQDILAKGIQLLSHVTCGDVLSVPLTRWLMEIQLKEKRGEKVQNEELGKFIDELLASVNKPEGYSLDADFVKAVLTVARIHGEVHEACKLLKRVETMFAEAYGTKHSLFGSLLYQVGRFHLGGGRINEAEIALKRAEEILIAVFGRDHPTVAACQLSLGTCAINKGNVRQATCLLNEAESVYKKINPEHPEVAEILLKLAVLHVEEGQKEMAIEFVKQALDIFKSVCGEVSYKTAGGYFQAGNILKMAGAGTSTAIDALLKAIDILSILGTGLDCTDMIMCHSLLGVLQLSLGHKKEAEESFSKAAYCDPPDTSTKILNPEDVAALFKIKAHQVLCHHSIAQVVCLVNLVHLTTGDERNKHFDSLVSWLHDHKMEELVILDFGGQTLSFISHAVFSSWGDAYLIQIVSSDAFSDSPKTDGGLGSDSKPKVFMYATSNLQGNKRPFVLFCTSGNPQDLKETRCVALAFRESVDVLFMQPKFRKVFLEGRTLCVELSEQTVSPLCMKIDCFPLLVEMRLAELHEDLGTVESVVPDSSVITVVRDSAHVFYHSFKLSNHREAEFVFSNLLSRLPSQLPLDRDIGLQHVSVAKNMAIFLLKEPTNLVVSITIQKQFIQVKIRLPREHLSSDICSSVTTPIKCIVDSLSDFVDLKSESSLQPSCEHTGEDRLENNEELSSDYVSMEPTSGSEGSLASSSVEIQESSGSSVDSACDEKRRPLEDFAHEKWKQGTPHSEIIEQKNCTEVGICLSLLELLLSKRCTSSGERRPSNVCEETKPDCAGVDISTQDYRDDLNNSLLSLDSAASLNSFPLDCQQGTLCPSTGLSCNATSRALPVHDAVLLAQQGVLANPSEDDGGCVCLDSKELQTDFDRNVDQCATSDGFPLSGFQAVSNHREGLPVAGTTCSDTFEHNCGTVEDSRQVTESICDANLEESRESTDNTLFMKDYIAVLENRLSVMQYELLELRPQVSLLEQQAKQAELEKEQALNDLGSHLVSEAREKRRKRIVLSSSECLSHKDSKTKRSCAVSPSHFSTKSNERLLGGEALPRRQRNSSSTGSLHLHQRLLEISNCLSEGELKCMKSLLKRRVNGFKLARIRDVSQLFEELEHREDSPLDVIKDLLLGIGRHDLLEKLTALLCVNREEGPNHVRRPNDCATKRPAAEQKSVVQEPPDSFPSLPELAESRGHGLNLSLGGHGQEMEGVLVQSSSEEESLQSLEEMENLRLGVREPVQVTDPTSLSSSENSNVSDAFSSYVYCSSESPSLCGHTVDEELSHCRKCPGGAMSHNWRCSGDARSLDSVPSPASSTGLVHGMLIDAEVPTSAHGSSVNGSCNHCDTSSAVQWASDEYSAMWKCSKVSSDHTVEQVRIEEEIATHSSERDGNGNKANKKYEDKEVLSKVSESERVQDHELSFHNREVEDRCVCPGRELLDTRESSSTMERDARTVLTEDNQDSSTESTVPLTRSDVGGMTVTLRSTGKQNHMKLLSESMRETHSIDYVDGNADQRIEGPGLLRDRIEEKQFPPSEAPYMLRDSVCGLRDAASRPLPVLLSSNMYLPSPISSEREENGVRSGVEVSPGTNSDEDGKYEVEECDGPVGPTQLPCNSFTPSYDNHENKLFSTEQEASDSPISASSSANSSLILDEQPYTNKEMVSAEGNGPDDSIETDCSLSASEGDRTVDNLAISSGTSDYWQRFGARPRDRKRVQGQQMERQPSPGNASHGKKLQTATFGVANSFLARHSLDQCLHHSLPLDDTEDWMPHEPHLKEEEGAYMDNAVDGASVSATTLSPVGELQELSSELDSAAQTTTGVSSMYGLRGGYDSSVGLRGGHYSSYGLRGGYDSSYGLRGGYDGSVVQSNNPGSGVLTPYLSSVEYSNINMELLPRPMLDYPSATDYTMSNNYPVWNGANNPPLNSIGSGSMSGVSGMLPIMGYDTDLYARTYGFSRQGLYGAASGSRPNQPGMDSSYLPDTLTPGDPFGHPGHQTLAGQRFGSMNEASPTNLFREDVSGRELSNAYSSNTSRSTLTYLEPENSGTSPETSNRTAYSHVTESGFAGLNWSDRLFSLPRGSSNSADQSASRGVAAKSRTETSTMTDRSTINPLWNGESNSASNDSPEAPDTSLLALEQRVSEACELVERVLRERQEREQASREVERREREIRAAREREAREREAASRSDHQEAIPGRPQWLCEHYQRHCRVRFPCCEQFYPCHRCHNGSGTCANEETKASHATHLKCAKCNHEQEINEGSQMCSSCGEKMSAYFCPICKHFTGVDKNPYHCEKCGICRIHQDRSFHCEVCNVCLDKRLQGKHKCRPDSGHDECCICLEDAFSGCQILPCSHKVHRECAIAMIQNGIRNCPICRHPLYTPPSN